MDAPSPGLYTLAQRRVALLYGISSHALFLASVVVMCLSLYRGLQFGVDHLHGALALTVNGLLILQFALGHTFLLSDRGRRWMTRLAPLGLGRDLSTTIFAGLASLQLIFTFVFWSPSEILWAAPDGWIKSTLTGLYILSWGLLAKSMQDAGLDTQLGFLGWRSIWQGKKPQYRPFTRTGMFRYSRQPIYSSFALILWTAPTWTPDHLFIAVLWTGYCVLAPLAKEKRYLRYYGQAFERYQKRVPYWFPQRPAAVSAGNLMGSPQAHPSAADWDIIIAGAGPVGMLLGCLLGERGFRVLILESRTELPAQSMAIGITPPSLQILAKLGLDEAFISQGVPIRDCQVHGQSGFLGCATFRDLPGRFRYILSLPQQVHMGLLEQKLAQYPNVTLKRGCEVQRLTQDPSQVIVAWNSCDENRQGTARWVVGCDGIRSKVRELLHMRTRGGSYGCHFVMGDFVDRSDLGSDAHLFFTNDGAVEAFPLPDGKRRWIVQTPEPANEIPSGFISGLVSRRAGLQLSPADQLNQSAFSPRWVNSEQYYDGRVILCGDAAHVMSPIGGQGMNTGWADAEFVAEMLAAIEHGGMPSDPLLRAYDHCRQKAAKTATKRAALGMWLGTRTGAEASFLRDLSMKFGLFKGPLASKIGPHFSMVTIPYNTIERVPCSTFRDPPLPKTI